MVDKKNCSKCKYRCKLNEVVCCQYILVEKKRRGCYSGKCDKFVKGDPYRTDFNEQEHY